MRKNTSKKIGTERNNNVLNTSSTGKRQQLEEKLLELEDYEIEALFEAGKIDQAEYEYILAFRKRKKERKKSQKEKFEERIRCNDTIIKKVINLGRRFRLQELLRQTEPKGTSVNRNDNVLDELLEDEKDIEREERIRSKSEQSRNRNTRHLSRDERSFGGRGRERDR